MKEQQLTAEKVVAGYDKTIIIDGINFTIPSHKISVIIGGNGCGKSTLLKTFSRLLKPSGGSILLNGKKIESFPAKALARTLGLLPQSPVVPEGITVFDLVCRGRFPYRKIMRGMDQADFDAVARALDTMGITELADRNVDELSGGQRQRVWIALALAQETDILLLDEPTTFLDIAYQIEILDLLTELNRKLGMTIVMVLHDINLSARYADHLFAMKHGHLIEQGVPKEVVSPELIWEVFGLKSTVMQDPISGAPLVIPISSCS
ncbi:MAG: ABC transporter ATP-binding protein [Lachnospiraceae bacterium]